MTTELATRDLDAAMAAVVTQGDLSSLTVDQQMAYYRMLCERFDLEPWSTPFRYLQLPGRDGQPGALVLYATKTATDQLRVKRRISIPDHRIRVETRGNALLVWATAIAPDGREDTDFGAVSLAYGRSGDPLTGDNLANAYMKAITKAKRRVTLSICGLSMLDETEADSIPGARQVGSGVAIPQISGPSVQDAQEGQSPTRHDNGTGVEVQSVQPPVTSLETLLSASWRELEQLREEHPKIANGKQAARTTAALKALADAFHGITVTPDNLSAIARKIAHDPEMTVESMTVAQAKVITSAANMIDGNWSLANGLAGSVLPDAEPPF